MWPQTSDNTGDPLTVGRIALPSETVDNLRRQIERFEDWPGSMLTIPAGYTSSAFDGMTGLATKAMTDFAAAATNAFTNWVERLGPVLHSMRVFPWDGWQDEWVTPTARDIAAGILESGDWSRLLLLADAIQDAGCEDAALLGLMRLAGGLGLDMGGWWLMERMTTPERSPLVPMNLMSGDSSGYNYASGRLADPRQGGEEAKRK